MCDHLFPLDGFSKELYHILPLTVCGLEAFGPGDKDALQSTDHQISLTAAQILSRNDTFKMSIIQRPGWSDDRERRR